jgi:hypothetical protein
MLELTKLKKQLAEKREQLAFHVRCGHEDRAAWCREDIALLSRREAKLEEERKKTLREAHARYQRTYYHKRSEEYKNSPQFAVDCEAAWKARFARREQRLARIAQREAQKQERLARIAAMGPEERAAFYRSERLKNSAEREQVLAARKWAEGQRAKLAQERRAKRSETRKRNAEERARILAGFEEAAKAKQAPPINTNPSDSPGLLIHHNDSPSSQPNT